MHELMTAQEWKNQDERHGCAVCRYRADIDGPAARLGCQVVYDSLSELNLSSLDELLLELPSEGICDNYDCDEIAFQWSYRCQPEENRRLDFGVRSGRDYPTTLQASEYVTAKSS